MNKVFLDCGSNFGQGFERWMKHLNYDLNNTIIYMFEPITNIYNWLLRKYTHPNINILNVACWSENTQRILNIETTEGFQWATNILQDNFKLPEGCSAEHIKEWPPKVSQTIQCINLSDFIKNNFSVNDDIFLKLDIEGSEYEVLDQMIKEDTLKYIKSANIEFHSHMRKTTTNKDSFYIETLKTNGVVLHNWQDTGFSLI